MKSKRNTASIVKGVGIGMTLGGITAVMGSSMMCRNKRCRSKNRAYKAMGSIGDFVDNLQYMMK